MTAEMSNDPGVLIVAALVAWALYGVVKWRERRRG